MILPICLICNKKMIQCKTTKTVGCEKCGRAYACGNIGFSYFGTVTMEDIRKEVLRRKLDFIKRYGDEFIEVTLNGSQLTLVLDVDLIGVETTEKVIEQLQVLLQEKKSC